MFDTFVRRSGTCSIFLCGCCFVFYHADLKRCHLCSQVCYEVHMQPGRRK